MLGGGEPGPPGPPGNLWGQNGSDIYYDSGNVGIGVLNPSTRFEVLSNTSSIWTTSIKRSDNAHRVEEAFVPAGSANPTNMVWMHGIPASQNQYRVTTWDGTSSNTRFAIDSNGNVGIRTSSTGGDDLHVYDGSGRAVIGVKGTGDGTQYSALFLRSDEATDKLWYMGHHISGNTLNFVHNDGSSWYFPLEITAAGELKISANGYLNFGGTTGSGGYGIRDNSGTIQVKNSGGGWASPGGVTAQTVVSCTGSNNCTTANCPAGYVRSGCSAWHGTQAVARPSGSAACECSDGDDTGGMSCHTYCVK